LRQDNRQSICQSPTSKTASVAEYRSATMRRHPRTRVDAAVFAGIVGGGCQPGVPHLSARNGAEEFSVAAIETLRAAIEFKSDLARPLLGPILPRQATQRTVFARTAGGKRRARRQEARNDRRVRLGAGASERLSAKARRCPAESLAAQPGNRWAIPL
jgi:hypothetical protein